MGSEHLMQLLFWWEESRSRMMVICELVLRLQFA